MGVFSFFKASVQWRPYGSTLVPGVLIINVNRTKGKAFFLSVSAEMYFVGLKWEDELGDATNELVI